MYPFTHTYRKKLFAVAVLLLVAKFSYGTIYTATQSGTFANTATWQGGNIPPSVSYFNDTIIINTGVTLDMTTYTRFRGVRSLLDIKAGAKIITSNNTPVDLGFGFITGAGDVIADSIYAAGWLYGYTGSITAEKMTIEKLVLASNCTVTFNTQLHLLNYVDISDGTFALGKNGASVICDGGNISHYTTGGSVDLTKTYDLYYKGYSYYLGEEFKGTGLGDITIELSSTYPLTLFDYNFTLLHKLHIIAGTFLLKNSEMTLGPGSSLEYGKYGYLGVHPNSLINITTDADISTGLKFARHMDTIGSLVVDYDNRDSMVPLGSDVYITGHLILKRGKVNCMGHTIEMITFNSRIDNASDSGYVITTDSGALIAKAVPKAAINYPVGTADAYTPLIIDSLDQSHLIPMSVTVTGDVKALGTTGSSIAQTQPMVKTTWLVTPLASGAMQYNAIVAWPQTQEVNGFDRNQCYLANYSNGIWNNYPVAAATTTGNYYSTRRKVTTANAVLSVFDNTTPASVKEYGQSAAVSIYPTPATDVLHVDMQSTQPVQASVFNTAGQMVYNAPLQNDRVDISALQPGVYILQLKGSDINTTAQFIKQ